MNEHIGSHGCLKYSNQI